MNAQRWRDVEAVLDVALDSDPTSWPAVLDQHCASDTELRREVETLLRHYTRAQRFLDSPPVVTAAALVAEAGAGTRMEGKRIGAYRVVRQIGQGGTARVYLAERDDGQFTQRVALKLLRPGHDSAMDQGRFRAERQILASLNHPNIARLLDGGMSEDGLPYLVMELVEGEPIDRYCETRALTVRERSRMFLTVCDATRYAHNNLVVHRDLKPSNILVTGDGQVKLLDFGLAKLLERRPDDRASAPLTSQHWMTPEYAAPEQVRGEPATTLTDVYQLGVVLFELLAGALPFGKRESSYDLARAILENEAPPPSSLNANARALRGDLDAIVLHALRKEPHQRYASVEALREDVERYLAGQPVRARQGNASYRASRFVRRHRLSVAAAALFVLLLAGYAATLTMNARRVRATLARVEQEKAKAESATQFLVGLFDPSLTGLGPRDTLTARQLLEHGERQAEELRGQPLAQAQMFSVLGTIHHGLRAYNRAQPMLERALELRRATLGANHVDVAESMFQLAIVVRSRGEYERAGALFTSALEIQRRHLGEEHPAVAATLLRLSLLGPVDEVIATAREALALARRVNGAEHPVVAETMLRLAMSLRSKGVHDEAEPLFREALAMRQRIAGSDYRSIARDMQQLAILLKHRGKLEESAQLHRSILIMQEGLYGADNPLVSGALRTLSEVLIRKGEFDEAERLARRDVAIMGRAFGTQHVDYAESLGQLADALRASGKLTEAESLRRQAVAIGIDTYGEGHLNVAGSLYNLGMVLLDQGKQVEAEQLLLEAKAIRDGHRGPESTMSAFMFPALARLARERGNYASADSLLQRAMSILKSAGYTDLQENMQEVHREFVALYEVAGKPREAAHHRRLLIVPDS